MRSDPQLSKAVGELWIKPVTHYKIWNALQGIGDLNAPGSDGYNAKFFKATWEVTGSDIQKVVQEFITYDRLYKDANSSMVTLIPKVSEAKTIK